MIVCPCCSDSLLRHTRAGQFYFFCQHCHLEIPEMIQAEGIGLPASSPQVSPAQAVLPENKIYSIAPLARP